jgi:UDP-N-acetylmuramate dehydrogenase
MYIILVMNIFQKVSLKDYSTMRLGGIAQFLVKINNKADLVEAVKWAKSEKLNMLMIGRGSNIIWRDEGYDGLILVNNIQGFETFSEDQENLYVTVGAGEDWDFVVKRTVDLGYSGIECLSLIPGSAGSTPIQNVGAYGSEIADSLINLEAYDTKTNQFVIIKKADCDFTYRSSKFKDKDKNRYFITAITLQLTQKRAEPPFYSSVQKYFDDNNLDKITPKTIREAVIYIRESKLPDPRVVPNSGSFFTNPIVKASVFNKLIKQEPTISYWEVDQDKYKLSAAWLIDKAGYKAVNDPESGISTWPTQPLVFVNTSAKTTSDLLKFKDKVVKDIEDKFGVTLVQEPELLP